MSTPNGKIAKQSTGQPIPHYIGGSDVGGEAASKVQKAWNANIGDLRTAFCNGFGRRQNLTLWKEGNFRLDLQSTSEGEERFAFQEGNAVHGQVHLKSVPGDAAIAAGSPVPARKAQGANWTIASFCASAMADSLKDGTIWEVYYEPPLQAQGQGNNKKK